MAVQPKYAGVIATDKDIEDPGNFITRSKPFKKLCSYAFKVCDKDSTGEIQKDELYTGVLYVHLMLAKYAGAAACFPASRETVNKLFDASDDNNSGTIDEEEFTKIMIICCGQIASRVLLYLALLLFIAPGVAYAIVMGVVHTVGDKDWFKALYHGVQDPVAKIPWLDDMIDWDDLAETIVSKIFFFAAFPVVFAAIDSFYQKAAEGKMLQNLGAKNKKAKKEE